MLAVYVGTWFNLKRVLVMICKGNFDGQLVDEFDGAVEHIDGYCVVICEDDNEWGALREAMHFRLKYLRENTIDGSPLFDYADDIKILERMYKETE